MIKVTEHAKAVLKSMLISLDADIDEGLRLMPTADNTFLLVVDMLLSGDQVVEYEGYKVLLVGVEYFNILDQTVLDCHETENGDVLLLQNFANS
jgi:hypothetical protein